MNVKAVLFDLDDTLLWDERSVQEAFDATCQEAARLASNAFEPKQLEEAVRREARALYESFETFPFTQQIGINPFEGLWGNFLEGEDQNFSKLKELAPYYRKESWTRGLAAVGIQDPELGDKLGEMFPMERRARSYVYEETFEVLQALKGQVKLLLLTNGSPDLQKEKLAGVPKMPPFFNHIVISGNFGQGKPSAEIFQYAMSLLEIEAHEGIMVGDKLTTDILGSSRVGMPNAWVNRHGNALSGDVVPTYEITNLRELLSIISS